MMSLEELVAGTEGRVVSQVERRFAGVGTDTRADLSGKLFIALKGDNFDAHDFLEKAVQAGAAALLVHRLPEGANEWAEKVTIVQVPDTLKALQSLATFWRRKQPAKIFALTGTNGKTTTKEFAATIIGSQRKVHFSQGSFNNHWGVPLTLLGIEPSHEFAIVEMGMNHSGEIAELCRIAEPDAVLVTMVGRGHLQGLGSVAAVAAAKAEIYEASPATALRIFNVENRHTLEMFERFGGSVKTSGKALTFSSGVFGSGRGVTGALFPTVDVSLGVAEMMPESMRIYGEIRGVPGGASIPVFGKQNITNLMAAAALALAAGLTPEQIWAAIPRCRTVWGRNQWVLLKSGAQVLFDGYNANPESMAAALENFDELNTKGRKFAILGEMREMGEHAASVHRELGAKAAQCGFDGISFFGPSKEHFVAGLQAEGFKKTLVVSDAYEQSLAPKMLPVLELGDIVLMKGSRGMALEKALESLEPIDFQP